MPQAEQHSILFVHEDLTFLMYISILVKRFGYDIYLARNGQDGLKVARENKPSVIVLDQDIPKIDANTCLSIIQADQELKGTPVLLMTSGESRPSLSPAGTTGYCGYIKKPLNISDFYSAVQRCHQYAVKRKYFRAPMLLKVSVEYATETRELYATNLSVEGMFLRAMTPYNIGAELSLIFSIDDEDPLEVHAMVVSSKSFSPEMKSEPGMGLKFINLAEDVKYRISYALMKEISKDLLQEGTVPEAGNYLDDSFA